MTLVSRYIHREAAFVPCLMTFFIMISLSFSSLSSWIHWRFILLKTHVWCLQDLIFLAFILVTFLVLSNEISWHIIERMPFVGQPYSCFLLSCLLLSMMMISSVVVLSLFEYEQVFRPVHSFLSFLQIIASWLLSDRQKLTRHETQTERERWSLMSDVERTLPSRRDSFFSR